MPCLAHLLGVAALVMGAAGHVPFPITEDIAIAAPLHDAGEDAGEMPRLHDIEANFGKEVARIVEGCSDGFEEDSSRKEGMGAAEAGLHRAARGRAGRHPAGFGCGQAVQRASHRRGSPEPGSRGPCLWSADTR